MLGALIVERWDPVALPSEERRVGPGCRYVRRCFLGWYHTRIALAFISLLDVGHVATQPPRLLDNHGFLVLDTAIEAIILSIHSEGADGCSYESIEGQVEQPRRVRLCAMPPRRGEKLGHLDVHVVFVKTRMHGDMDPPFSLCHNV